MKPDLTTYKYFVQGLVKQSCPKKILEIGLGETASTAEKILDVLPKNSIYYTIDISPNPKALDILNKYPKEKWRVINGPSSEFQSYEGINDCDIVLIDGDHNSISVHNDTRMCILRNSIKHDGVFIYHDANRTSVKYGIEESARVFNLNVVFLYSINVAIANFNNK